LGLCTSNAKLFIYTYMIAQFNPWEPLYFLHANSTNLLHGQLPLSKNSLIFIIGPFFCCINCNKLNIPEATHSTGTDSFSNCHWKRTIIWYYN
jgi:hypothetical protein